MRKLIFFLLLMLLLGIVTARALLPEPTQAVMADPHSYGYNILDISLSLVPETAGSAILADMNGYFLFRTPTAKNEWTGALRGKNLILICADAWQTPAKPDRHTDPALCRLRSGGADISLVYRPDWYQGMAGREFALLTGLVPTKVNGAASLLWTAEQDIYLPYTPARCLAQEGYTGFAYITDPTHTAAYEAMGFQNVFVTETAALETLEATLPALLDRNRFFAFYLWPDAEGAEALAYLLETLREARMLDATAICLLTADADGQRAQLYLYNSAVADAASDKPCSELDITPTLLNLFGVEYDSRFLSGRDVFAENDVPGRVRAVTPLVSLYGSAYSDWVTDAGSYNAAGSIFRQTRDCFADSSEITAYVRDVSQLVYDRYTYARKVMENNYFAVVFGAEAQLQ